MKSVILFDVGGVIDGGGAVSGNQTTPALFSERFGVDPQAFILARRKAWRPLKLGKISVVDFWTSIFNELEIPVDIAAAMEVYEGTISAVPGMLDLVSELNDGGYTLALANNEGREFDDLRESKFDYFRLFKHRFPSWKLGLGKPDPAYFQEVLKRGNWSPQQCIFVDDKMINVQASIKEGITGIHCEANARILRSALISLGVKLFNQA